MGGVDAKWRENLHEVGEDKMPEQNTADRYDPEGLKQNPSRTNPAIFCCCKIIGMWDIQTHSQYTVWQGYFQLISGKNTKHFKKST